MLLRYNRSLRSAIEKRWTSLKENDSAWKLPEDFFIISEQKQFKQLQEQALKLACTDPRKIFESRAFLKLNEGSLIQLLKRDDLELNEIEIFEYLIKWGVSNTEPTLNVIVRKWWSSSVKKVLRNCIPHIRFFQMRPNDYYEKVQNKFKDILPDGLDYEVTQHFKDFNNPLVRIPTNDKILPPKNKKST